MASADSSPRSGLAAGIALVLVVATASFGAYVRRLGIYYDDWPSWYLHLTGGPSALVALASGQGRPLAGLLPLLAGSPAGSHVLMGAVHLANGVLVLLLLRRLWPAFPSAAALASALYLIYPNYWIRPTHIALAIDGSVFLALLSQWLGLMAVDQRGARRIALTTASALLVPGYLLLYELPFGLELVRPALFALRPQAEEGTTLARARGALRAWFPWLVVLAIFVGWRTLVFRPSGDYARLRWNEISTPGSPAELAAVAVTFLRVCGEQAVGTWGTHIRDTPWGEATAGGVGALLAAVAAVVAVLLLVRRRREEPWGSRGRAAGRMAGLGLLVLVLGQTTQVLTGKFPTVTGLNSRWGLVSGLGAALLWVAVLEVLPGGRTAAAGRAALAALVGLGTFWHAANALNFARDWEQQRQVFWQLAWRAPSFAPGTVLLLDWRLRNAQDRPLFWYETTMAADLFYGAARALPALTVDVAPTSGNPPVFSLAGRDWVVDLQKALVVTTGHGCLEILGRGHPAPPDKPLSPKARGFRHGGAVPAERIRAAPDPTPPHRLLFAPEPHHGWCYLYQQARLAEERGDWPAVARLGDEAASAGLRPAMASEVAPFREASERVGRGAPVP